MEGQNDWLEALARIYADAAKNRVIKKLKDAKAAERSKESEPLGPRDKTRKK
jgi:hypothetical protein